MHTAAAVVKSEPSAAAVAAKPQASTAAAVAMPDASASAGLDRFVEPDRVFFLSSQHEDIIGYAIRLGFVGDNATVTAVVKTDR